MSSWACYKIQAGRDARTPVLPHKRTRQRHVAGDPKLLYQSPAARLIGIPGRWRRPNNRRVHLPVRTAELNHITKETQQSRPDPDCSSVTPIVLPIVLKSYLTNALGSGTSPAMPNCCIKVPPPDLFAYQVDDEGLNTAASIFPSPS